MKVYLGTSCLQRPLDSRTQVRICLEAEAMVGVIALIEDIDVLLREIGVVNTVRFVNQFTGGYGDYTAERQRLFGNWTLDENVAAIEQDRDANADAPS